jgi:flagellar motor switch protein FliM
MEHLLGAAPEMVEQPADRLLSVIELELAVTVFEKIANVLRSAVNAAGGFEPIARGAACQSTARRRHR